MILDGGADIGGGKIFDTDAAAGALAKLAVMESVGVAENGIEELGTDALSVAVGGHGCGCLYRQSGRFRWSD